MQGRVDAVLRLHDQGQVEGVRQQVGDQVLRAALVDVQGDAGVVRRGSGAAPPGPATVHRLGVAPSRTSAAAQPDEVLHGVAGGVGVGDDPLGQRQQRLAGRGERDVAADPLEQRRAERGFQGVNLLTQRGLGDTEQRRPLG